MLSSPGFTLSSLLFVLSVVTYTFFLGTMAEPLDPTNPSLVVCTRIHLGKASVPPTDESLSNTISSFVSLVLSSKAFKGAIAVDPEPKIPGFDLPSKIQSMLPKICENFATNDEQCKTEVTEIEIISVSPWGQFIPALNALVAWASRLNASYVLFASAETTLPPDAVSTLLGHFDKENDSTLVVGAVLPGHDYNEQHQRRPLTGRTSPWNTAAVWKTSKLALTGFPLVAEGVHRDLQGSPVASGIEEVSTIMLLQKLLPPGTAEAKLVKLPGVKWDTQKWEDEGRRKWHESKMQSKVQRAAKHMELLGFTSNEGTVLHL